VPVADRHSLLPETCRYVFARPFSAAAGLVPISAAVLAHSLSRGRIVGIPETDQLPAGRLCLTLAQAGRNLDRSVGAYRFRRERLRLGGMPGVHTTRNRRGTKTTANTQYAYAA